MTVGLVVALALGACDAKKEAPSGGDEAPAEAASEAKELSGDEITSLFADKTVKGHHERKDYDFRSYYAADGTFRSHQGPDGELHEGTWRVDGPDICIRWKDESEDLCRRMVQDPDGSYRKVKLRGRKPPLTVVTFESFTDGNPEDL